VSLGDLVAATCHRADSETGDHVDDPSEDAVYMLIDDLNDRSSSSPTRTTPLGTSQWPSSTRAGATKE
jgi:hypothetical protein